MYLLHVWRKHLPIVRLELANFSSRCFEYYVRSHHREFPLRTCEYNILQPAAANLDQAMGLPQYETLFVRTFCAYAAEFSWNSLIPASSRSRTSSRSPRRTCEWHAQAEGENGEGVSFFSGESSACACRNNAYSPRQAKRRWVSHARCQDRRCVRFPAGCNARVRLYSGTKLAPRDPVMMFSRARCHDNRWHCVASPPRHGHLENPEDTDGDTNAELTPQELHTHLWWQTTWN